MKGDSEQLTRGATGSSYSGSTQACDLVENLKYDVPNSGTLVAKSNDAGSASVAGDKLGRMHAA